MSEALQVVINYGSTSIKLHLIEANVNPDNQASIKLLEKKRFCARRLLQGKLLL
ncbi:MAG: hypothetical protein JWR05_3135 [Mucilaginibacter sp.]|nr:hypothetical protein [Mucilaginibacter sp.]